MYIFFFQSCSKKDVSIDINFTSILVEFVSYIILARY